MFHDLCNPLTMKLMALGRPLQEAEEHSSSPPPDFLAYRKAERLAAVIVVWVVVLCAMMGYTISIAGVPEREPDNRSGPRGLPCRRTGRVNGCGILPAGAGNTVGSARSLLHTQ
jgi:hypothetical protein